MARSMEDRLFSDEALANAQKIADALVVATRDVLDLPANEATYFMDYPYEAGATIYRIVESLLEAVCVLIAATPVRNKRTGARSYFRAGMRQLGSLRDFHGKIRALERSAIPRGVVQHVHPLAQMLAMVPLGVDVPRAGLVLREWVISMSDFYNAKSKGPAEAAALDRLYAARAKASRGGGLHYQRNDAAYPGHFSGSDRPAGNPTTPSPRSRHSAGAVTRRHAANKHQSSLTSSGIVVLANSPIKRSTPLSRASPGGGKRQTPGAARRQPHPASPGSLRGKPFQHKLDEWAPASPSHPYSYPGGSPPGRPGSQRSSSSAQSPRPQTPPQKTPLHPRAQRTPPARRSPRLSASPGQAKPAAGRKGGSTWARSPTGRSPTQRPSRGRSEDSRRSTSTHRTSPRGGPAGASPGGRTPPYAGPLGPSGHFQPFAPEYQHQHGGSAFSPGGAQRLPNESPIAAAGGLPPRAPISPRFDAFLDPGASFAQSPPGNRLHMRDTPEAIARLYGPAAPSAVLDFSNPLSVDAPEITFSQTPPRHHLTASPIPSPPYGLPNAYPSSTGPGSGPPSFYQQPPPFGAAAPPAPAERQQQLAELRAWLAARSLDKYTDRIAAAGIGSVSALMQTDEHQLAELPIGPKRKLLAYISGKLRL
ncbi:hypothetical protein DIPPA_10155 [Diplonema papillatum]|nr:hypothetical protein DIPPA_10155 [Diplonema papillatum]